MLRAFEFGELSDDLVVRLNGDQLRHTLHVPGEACLSLLGETALREGGGGLCLEFFNSNKKRHRVYFHAPC